MNTSTEPINDESNKKRRSSPSSLDKPAKMPKDDIKEMMKEMLTEMEGRLFVEIGKLRNEVSGALDEMKKKWKDFDEALDSLDFKINDLEQENLNASIALVGLPPVKKGYDVLPNIAEFGNALGVTIVARDLKEYYAFNLKSGSGSQINLTFWQEFKKREVMIKYKEKMKADSPILVHMVVPDLDKNSSFKLKKLKLYPQLTRYNQHLLKNAHQHHDRFKFIWFGMNKVMLRASENSPFIKILSAAHLKQVVQEAPIIYKIQTEAEQKH